MSLRLHDLVELKQEDDAILLSPAADTKEAMDAHWHQCVHLLNNLVKA
jgi:large subunit ribosomal protein L6